MKTKKFQLAIILFLAATFSAYVIFNYINKDHRNIAEEKVDFEISSNDLRLVMTGLNTSQQYVDRVIKTAGTITSIEPNTVIIDDRVQVNFIDTELKQLAPNAKISIKGRCVGYDDLLELVKIDQATIVKSLK